MKTRSEYLKILGLTENATKKDIKKAYRNLALHYHPDLNKDQKASDKFLLLKEAYDFLIIGNNETKVENRKQKTKVEREFEAKIRFKKQQERKFKEQNDYFNKITTGKSWFVFKIYSFFALFIAFLLFIEAFLPRIYEKQEIIAKSEFYNGLLDGQVIGIKTDKNLKIFVKNAYPNLIVDFPEIIVEQSFIFHNPYAVIFEKHNRKRFDVDFSVVNLFPASTFFFSIPFIVFYFKRKSYWFTLGLLFSKYIISISLVYFLLTQNRLLHFITFGII